MWLLAALAKTSPSSTMTSLWTFAQVLVAAIRVGLAAANICGAWSVVSLKIFVLASCVGAISILLSLNCLKRHLESADGVDLFARRFWEKYLKKDTLNILIYLCIT